MKVKPKSNDYYKKYKYLIWRDDIGFLHLETFGYDDLQRFVKSINDHIEERLTLEEDANIKTID
jgi:hypothetical protein